MKKAGNKRALFPETLQEGTDEMNRMLRPMLAILPVLLCSVIQTARSTSPLQTFTITAKRFSFQPDEITVQKGRPVILDLISKDVTHGLKCKELGVNATIHKGQTTEVKFTPHEAGRFVGRCSHFCGIGHGSMTLVINVVDK
jgi:cytochrome c oxidase subunit II